MRVQPGRPIVPLQNCRRRLETPGPKDGCGGPRSQRRPYHRKSASRLEDPKRQRMAEKSSLRDEAKMHPPQASEKRREFDVPEVSFVVNIKCLLRGGGGGIRTRDTVSRIHTFQACAFDRSATPPSRALTKTGAGEPHSTGRCGRASRGWARATTAARRVARQSSGT